MTDTLTLEAPPTTVPTYPERAAFKKNKKNLSLEERTDVTVDELEKTSLPASAELYNGNVVFKNAEYRAWDRASKSCRRVQKLFAAKSHWLCDDRNQLSHLA